MKIDIKTVTIAELCSEYVDKGEEGIRGYGNLLNIRPPYQREFIYGDQQRNEVIHTVRKNFPLNTMYWAVSDDGYELMDGQQRTVSICRYVSGDFSVEIDGNPLGFYNLPEDKKQQILDYKLSVYVCEGSPSEKLDWFRIINIAGEKLTDQELRNAIYTGPWLADAKRWFSRSGCPAVQHGDKYVNGSPIRQQVLETALEWISADKVDEYMAVHQHDHDAQELWLHFQTVIDWVKRVFPTYRREMKGLDWGKLHRLYGEQKVNPAVLEARIVELYLDDEVTAKKGVYEYLLSGNEKTLNLRTFTEKDKAKVFEIQRGLCPICKKTFTIEHMEADHIIPWSKGGKTNVDNLQMLCMRDNRQKSGK